MVVPYFIWCVIGTVFSLVTKNSQTSDLTFLKVFFGDAYSSWHPMGRAIWYVRDLIVFTLISPVYYMLAKKMGLTLGLFFVIGFSYFQIITPGYDFPSFNIWIFLGSLLSIHGVALSQVSKRGSWRIIMPFFMAYQFFATFYGTRIPLFYVLAWIGLFSLCIDFKISNRIIGASTFLYFAHAYLTSIYRVSLVHMVSPSNMLSCVFVYLIAVSLTLITCYLLYITIKKASPRLLGYITGGRA